MVASLFSLDYGVSRMIQDRATELQYKSSLRCTVLFFSIYPIPSHLHFSSLSLLLCRRLALSRFSEKLCYSELRNERGGGRRDGSAEAERAAQRQRRRRKHGREREGEHKDERTYVKSDLGFRGKCRGGGEGNPTGARTDTPLPWTKGPPSSARARPGGSRRGNSDFVARRAMAILHNVTSISSVRSAFFPRNRGVFFI